MFEVYPVNEKNDKEIQLGNVSNKILNEDISE